MDTEIKSRKARKKGSSSVWQAAGILTITMMVSRILGFVRDFSVTSSFGFGYEADAYAAAFTVPDLIYFALVGGALSSAFIPVFSGYLATKQEEDGYRMASTILNIVSLAALALIALGLLFTPQLISLLVDFSAYSQPEKTISLTILLTRVMFAQCFFMCLAGISQGILQCYKEFATPAFGAVVYNIAIIVIGLALCRQLGILAFTIGVVIGAAMNLAMQIRALVRYGFGYRPVIDLHHPGVKQFFLLFLPVVLGLSMNELNLLVSQRLASSLAEGTIMVLKQAQRIMMLPVGIFAASIGLSVFPTMTSHMARGEVAEYKQNLTMGLRTIIFITLPAAVGLMVLSFPVVRAMYYQGQVTPEAIQMVATSLVFYCIGLVGYSAQQILNRGFYAIKDTRSPVTINVFVLLCNIGLSVLFLGPLGYKGLALAYSLSGLLSMAVLGLALRRKIGPYGGTALWKSALQSVLASAVMGLVVWASAAGLEQLFDLNSKLLQIGQVVVCIGIGGVVYAVMAIVLGMEEARMVLRQIKRKLHR